MKIGPLVNPPCRPLWFQRVGFNLCFSVKRGVLWAAESDPPREFRGGKHFKKLVKMAEKVKSPRVMYITLTDPERIRLSSQASAYSGGPQASGFSLR